jgi:hypothetical protein
VKAEKSRPARVPLRLTLLMPSPVTSPAGLQVTNSQLHGLVELDHELRYLSLSAAKVAFHFSSAPAASRAPPAATLAAGAAPQSRRETQLESSCRRLCCCFTIALDVGIRARNLCESD